MQTKLLREIKIALPNLRKSEVKVAEFILNKPSAIIELTTAQASSEIGVSEPTLIMISVGSLTPISLEA